MNGVTKTMIAEKYIAEIDKTMNFLQKMKQYCGEIVMEEEAAECGMLCCCDGINDPENLGCQWWKDLAIKQREQERVDELQGLKELEKSLKSNMFLKLWDGNVDMMSEILKNYDKMCFPKDCFPTANAPEQVKIVYVSESELPPEVMHSLEFFRRMFGR